VRLADGGAATGNRESIRGAAGERAAAMLTTKASLSALVSAMMPFMGAVSMTVPVPFAQAGVR
jgi:hypothetical protein